MLVRCACPCFAAIRSQETYGRAHLAPPSPGRTRPSPSTAANCGSRTGRDRSDCCSPRTRRSPAPALPQLATRHQRATASHATWWRCGSNPALPPMPHGGAAARTNHCIPCHPVGGAAARTLHCPGGSRWSCDSNPASPASHGILPSTAGIPWDPTQHCICRPCHPFRVRPPLTLGPRPAVAGVDGRRRYRHRRAPRTQSGH